MTFTTACYYQLLRPFNILKSINERSLVLILDSSNWAVQISTRTEAICIDIRSVTSTVSSSVVTNSSFQLRVRGINGTTLLDTRACVSSLLCYGVEAVTRGYFSEGVVFTDFVNFRAGCSTTLT